MCYREHIMLVLAQDARQLFGNDRVLTRLQHKLAHGELGTAFAGAHMTSSRYRRTQTSLRGAKVRSPQNLRTRDRPSRNALSRR
jgi:hypothetical protein